MTKTLLQIVQTAQAELGLTQSATVAGNSDVTTVQMFALANRCLDELRRMARWTSMQSEFDMAVPAAVTTTGNMQAGSAIITNIPNTSSLTPATAWAVQGTGLLQASRIQTVDSATQVTLNMRNTNTADVNGSVIVFGQDTYAMPTDFDWFNNRTMWDRTNRWELLGPDSPQLDQWHRSGIVAVGPRRHYRKIGPTGTSFRIWPAPFEITQPLQLVFEYLTINAVAVHGGTTYAQNFVNDDDIPLLDDQSVIMGIKWMFWEIKGFGSYATAQGRWVDYVNRLIARDGAAPTLQLAKRMNPIFLSPSNVQDGFFPGPSGPNTG